MRPQSIELFEKVYLGAIAIGLVNTVLSWSQVDAMLADPRMQAAGLGTGTLMFGLVIGILLPLLLWWLVARRASNIAKWVLVVLTVIGLFGFFSSVFMATVPKDLNFAVSAVANLLSVYAAWLLFRPDAVAWLDSKGADGPGDPSTFD